MLRQQAEQVAEKVRAIMRIAPRRGTLRGMMAWVFAGLCAVSAAAATPDYALLDEVLLQNVRNGYVDYDGDLEDQERTLKSYFNAKPSAFNAAKSAL